MGKKFNIDGSLQVTEKIILQGDLEVKGSTTTVNQENLAIEDNIIITNANGGAVPDTGVVAVTGKTRIGIKPASYWFDDSSLYEFCKLLEQYGDLYFNFIFSNESCKGIRILPASVNEYDIVFVKENSNFENSNFIFLAIYNSANGTVSIEDPSVRKELLVQTIQYPKKNNDTDGSIAMEMITTLCPQMAYSDSKIQTEEAYAAPMFDADDSLLKIGQGYIVRDDDGNVTSFEFVEGEAQAVATRADNISDNAFVSWSSADNKLVDANLANGTGLGSIKSSNLNDDDRPYTEDELSIASGHEAIAFGKKVKATGKRSVAIGNGAHSSGNTSVSIGQNSIASNNVAVALGYHTIATAERSMAVNDYTEANGARSFAANWKTKANGDNSAAFGVRNTADGDADFITGIDNYSNAYAGFITGRNNNATRNGVFIAGQGNKAESRQNQAIFGEYNLNKGDTLLEVGNGNSDADRSNAFEVLEDGKVRIEKSIESTFTYSSEGTMTSPSSATNMGAIAFGENCEASGLESLAFGKNSIANGKRSVAIGNKCKSYGNTGFTIGQVNTTGSIVVDADGHPILDGNGNEQYIGGAGAFTGGNNNINEGNYAITFGQNNRTDGYASATFGLSNTIEGEEAENGGDDCHIVAGKFNKIYAGNCSAVFGNNNELREGGASFIAGGENKILESSLGWNTVFGYSNKIQGGQYNIISGAGNTLTSSTQSTIFGNSNVMTNNSSFIVGGGNVSSGGSRYHFVIGSNNEAYGGDWETLIGLGLISRQQKQVIVGTYNEDSLARFVVGNGTGTNDRKNAFMVLSDGRAKVQTKPSEINDVVRLEELQKVEAALTDSLEAVESRLNELEDLLSRAERWTFEVENNGETTQVIKRVIILDD